MNPLDQGDWEFLHNVLPRIEGIALLMVLTALGYLAKGRGLRHFRITAFAATSFLILRLGLPFIVPFDLVFVLAVAPAWLWLGAVAFWLRFVVGRKEESPGGLWVCHRCGTTNEGDYVRCYACGQRWSSNESQKR
jgi:hypothetical protein